MTVQEWLEYVRKLDRLIDAKLAERDRLVAMSTDISAKMPDGMPYNFTGTVSRKTEEIVVSLIMLAEDINKLVDRYIDYKADVIRELEKLPEKEHAVLHRRYIRYMTWEQIAEDLGYSTMQVWRIKKNAFKNLEDVIECYTEKWYNV